MVKTRAPVLALILIALSLLAAGCGPAKPAALSDEEVITLTVNILNAMEDDDYAAFTSDFSTDMLGAFSEAQFTDLSNMLESTSGGFVSAGELTLSNNKGYALYRITCAYELEDVVVTIVFKVDGIQVEGLFFDSPALRAASQ